MGCPSSARSTIPPTPTITLTPTQTNTPRFVSFPLINKEAEEPTVSEDGRFVAYTNSIQAYWQQAYPNYEITQTRIFSGQTATACGTATSAVGPFYCPIDKIVYLDASFFDNMLESQLGAAGGDAAEAYVIAHEYGHHISNLTGVLPQVQAGGNAQAGPASGQVRLELQADCYAGAWLKNATADPNSPIKAITVDDVNRAVDAALAVGDDRIQMASTGSISPESWTHGSSEQRVAWFRRGLESGDMKACDTFGAMRGR